MSAERPALTTRTLDFWLLGGASILVWAAMSASVRWAPQSWAVGHHFENLAAAFGTLALLVNYPHFMGSYKLAYGQGWRFLLRHWFQLLAVPLGLVLLVALGYRSFDQVPEPDGLLRQLNQSLRGLGLETRLGAAPTVGRELMGLLLGLMYLTVGWHYSKQVYGCMRVYAAYDRYRLSPGQWRLVKVSLFTIWFLSFVDANTSDLYVDMQGIRYAALGLPAWLEGVVLVGFLYGVCAVGLLFWRVARTTGQRPGLTMLVPYAAFVLWWVPPFVQPEFFIFVVPFFHSLQYLPFVYRLERERLSERHPSSLGARGSLVALGLVASGFLAFELLPNLVDQRTQAYDRLDAWFFFVSALVCINVHHYFIDNVIWRFSDARVREYLLPSDPAPRAEERADPGQVTWGPVLLGALGLSLLLGGAWTLGGLPTIDARSPLLQTQQARPAEGPSPQAGSPRASRAEPSQPPASPSGAGRTPRGSDPSPPPSPPAAAAVRAVPFVQLALQDLQRLREAGQPEKALLAAERALAMQRRYVPARVAYAELLDELGRPDQALVAWRATLAEAEAQGLGEAAAQARGRVAALERTTPRGE